jgi:metal-responsive CopG/Arc/MetJ family transcriptional regulator
MANRQQSVRQTFVLPADLIGKVDEVAARSKRSRNSMVEVLLEQALRERDRRFQKYKEVQKKIMAAATDEEADQYGDELIEAIFGPQERKSKRA